MIETNPGNIKNIPKSLRSFDIYKIAIRLDSSLVKCIPNGLFLDEQYYELYKIVYANTNNIELIPKKFKEITKVDRLFDHEHGNDVFKAKI